MSKTTRRILLATVAVAIAGLLAALVQLSRTSVETTASGAPIRLKIPLIGKLAAAVPIYSGVGQQVVIPGFMDGPVVRRARDGSWSATWFCEDRAGSARGSGATLHIECAGKRHAFALQPTPLPAAVAPMPGRLAVLSDLEGNIAFLDQALRKLRIVDGSGDWQYGSGHLVILGDSVDRGRDVFAVLWRLHGLAAQAHAAGGAVHVLLGNHEQYLLRTLPVSANRDHLHALNAMGGYRQAFAEDTVIGHWLRQQPVLLKLGPVLFAHAGVSPEVARSGLSVAQINEAMKDYWQASPTAHQPSPARDAVLSQTGVTQYRGYFRAMDGTYALASDADVQLGLAHFGVDRVVVAHTLVERVESLHGDRVFAVDVNDDAAMPEVLTFENGVATVVDIGVPRHLGEAGATRLREFSLGDAADRKLLAEMVTDIRRLSALPHPY